MLKGTPTHIPQGFCPVKLRSSREHFVWETNDSLCKLMLQRPRNNVVCSGAIHDEYTSRAARRNNESPAKNLCKWRYLVKKLSPLIALFSWKRRKIPYVSHFLFDFSDKPPTQRKVALHSCSSQLPCKTLLAREKLKAKCFLQRRRLA